MLSPFAKPGDNIEQSMCREKTDEEQEAVKMATVVRMLLDGGGTGNKAIRLNPGAKPFNLD